MQKKFKIIYGIFICLWAFLATTNAFGQTSWGQAGDFQYTGDGLGTAVSIYKYVGSDAAVVIPDTIIGLPVTGIGGAFTDNTTLTSVTIPTSVTSIGGSAFSGCTGLTSITIPTSVTSIGGSAFSGCTGLTSITIPASVTSISNAAFTGCTALTSIDVDVSNPNYSSIDGVLYNNAGTTLIIFPWGKSATFTVPAGVTTIGGSAFQNCTSLTGITIPSGVTTIQANAFNNTGLTSVTIPDSVTSILAGAFRNCDSLTSITVDAANTAFSSLSGVLYNKLQTTLVQYPAGIAGAFAVPSVVTTIGANSFVDSDVVTSVSIPDSVTTINTNALRGCPGLTSIDVDASNPNYSSLDGVLYNKAGDTLLLFPGGIAGAFAIPSGVTTIADQAFQNCQVLTSVTIPTGVTSIGVNAFSGSEALTSVTIPNTVSTIMQAAFTGCTGLTSMTLPASVTNMDGLFTSFYGGQFWDCTSLTSITVDPSNPNYSSVDGVMYNKLGTTLFQYPGGKTDSAFTVPAGVTIVDASSFRQNKLLTSVTIPDSVTSFGGTYVFYRCTALTSVTIGNGIPSLPTSTFQDCTGLTSVTIGNSVATLGRDAFAGCTSLTSITIPSSVTKIGTNANNTRVFDGCNNLSVVSFLGNAPTLYNINAFFGTTADFHVCYADGATGFSDPWNGYPAAACSPSTTTIPPTTTTTIPATVIELSSFTAEPGNGSVTLKWITETEIDNAGFNILRANRKNGDYEQINESLIPSEGSAIQGASYEYTDTSVQNGKKYFYKLEDIDMNATSTLHGPVKVKLKKIHDFLK